MEKQILLEGNGQLGHRSTRIAYGFVGSVFTVNGISTMVRSGELVFSAFGILLIGAGLYYLIVAVFLMRKKGPYMPRVELYDRKILLKSQILAKTQVVIQDELKRVSFDSYRLRFYMNKRENIFDYATKPEISIQVKEAVRHWCQDRKIPVEDG